MSLPLVSVIIRTNAARQGCLQNAIDSIMGQTWKNIEIVLVENGSNVLESWLLENFRQDETRSISYYQLDGADRCMAGNLGLAKAKGEYLCFLDDDDLFYPEHIEMLAGALNEKREVAAAYSLAEEQPSKIISYTPFEVKEGTKKRSFQREFSRGALFVNNYLAIQCVLFRKKLFKKYGGFDRELEKLEDWHLWVSYASQDDFLFVNRITSLYRTPYEVADILKRDQELDQFYALARSKQEEIKTILDKKLLKEIIDEIMRPSVIASQAGRWYSNRMIEQSETYRNYCDENGIDLAKEGISSSVLKAIELSNQIILENRFLWFLLRTEHKLKHSMRLSLIKRLWQR